MSDQTLNIIYDTNYTNLVPDGGFVDYQFSNKKIGFRDSLFWKPTNETNNQKNPNPDQADTQSSEPKKAPGFWDLLFWDLNSSKTKKSDINKDAQNNWETVVSEQNNTTTSTTEQTAPEQNDTNIPNTEQNNAVAPVSEQNDTTAPTTQQNNETAWTTEQNNVTATVTEQNNVVAPVSEQKDTTAPVSEQNNITTPTSEQSNTTTSNENIGTITQNHEIANEPSTLWNEESEDNQKPKKKKSWIDSMLDNVFGPEWWTKKEKKSWEKIEQTKWNETDKTPEPELSEQEKKANELREQIRKVLEIPDSEYKDSMITSDMRRFIKQVDEEYTANIADFKSHIAPSYWEYKSDLMNISGILWKTYYTQRYPTYIDALWTRDLMSMHAKWDMSFFIYPEDDSAMQAMLKRKSTQLKAELNEAMSKGITTDKEVEQQYRDVELIREKLSTREERYFELSNYFTIYNWDENILREDWKKFEQKVSGYGIAVKPAIQRMDEWMTSSLPLCIDDLWISRSAVTSSLAWSFPFISNDLVQNTWIFYGLNLHTWWLIIMDRFNGKLPNMNSVILATSWAWKSFTVKLEILRYLLNWIDIIVIDPENEYKELCEAVGWTYINIATNAQQYINPFDLPPKIEDVEYGKWDLLRSQIMTLIWLIQILIWKLTPEEEAVLDKALQNTYALRGFSLEEDDYEWKQPPLMEDLMNILNGMEWWEQVGLRLSKYVTWTFGKLFNNYTNVDINNRITVFSIRDLEDALKTPAMYNVLNFIRTKVRSMKRQRLLVCDEAWIMLQNDVSANFMFSMTKRARKYWLWITTISQDIEDFVRSPYGKPIVSNSSIQILLKQSTTSIKSLNQLLWLSEAEQQKLISCGVWEWLIFTWNQHIALKIVASPVEKELITTDVKKKKL